NVLRHIGGDGAFPLDRGKRRARRPPQAKTLRGASGTSDRIAHRLTRSRDATTRADLRPSTKSRGGGETGRGLFQDRVHDLRKRTSPCDVARQFFTLLGVVLYVGYRLP